MATFDDSGSQYRERTVILASAVPNSKVKRTSEFKRKKKKEENRKRII